MYILSEVMITAVEINNVNINKDFFSPLNSSPFKCFKYD